MESSDVHSTGTESEQEATVKPPEECSPTDDSYADDILAWLVDSEATIGMAIFNSADAIDHGVMISQGLLMKKVTTAVSKKMQAIGRMISRLSAKADIAIGNTAVISANEAIAKAEADMIQAGEGLEDDRPTIPLAMSPQDEPAPPPDDSQSCLDNCLKQGYTVEQCIAYCKEGTPLPQPPPGGPVLPPPPTQPPDNGGGTTPPDEPWLGDCVGFTPCHVDMSHNGTVWDGLFAKLWRGWATIPYYGQGRIDIDWTRGGAVLRNEYGENPTRAMTIVSVPVNPILTGKEPPSTDQFKTRIHNLLYDSPVSYNVIMAGIETWEQYTQIGNVEHADVNWQELGPREDPHELDF